jgi:hypothetical protein
MLPDVNLLVHAYSVQSPKHAAARAWWERALNSRASESRSGNNQRVARQHRNAPGRRTGSSPVATPPPSDRLESRVATCLALGLALIFFVQAACASRHHSLTWDEPSFVGAGYAYLSRGEFRFNPSHPPLLQAIEAAPLVLLGARSPHERFEYWQGVSSNPVAAFGESFVFKSGNDPLWLARWARLPILLFGTMLVFTVFLWGRGLYGSRAALLGTALAATCPNLIAHAGLATEDLGCSALLYAAAWTFWLAYRHAGTWRWARCGLVTGLALISKYTALVVVPSFVVIATLIVVTDHSRLGVVQWGRALATVAIVAAGVVSIAYGPRWGWPLYIRGLRSVYGDSVASYTYYLAGTFSTTATWYYTLAALAFKVSATTLVLMVAALAFAMRPQDSREDALFVLVPAAAVIAASFFDAANIGLRRILPAFPFLYLFTSRLLDSSRLLAWPSGRWRTVSVSAVVVLAGWSAVETIRIYPHHLSYFSAASGGPLNGPYLLDDSNIDWGQDLPALADWQRQHPEAKSVRLAYFGTAVPEAYGVRASTIAGPGELVDPVPGTYAISVQVLIRMRQLAQRSDARVDWLTRYRPIGRAGYSIFLYRVP